MNDIKLFAQSAIVVIIQDILHVDIIIPRLVFDHSTNPHINQGYYMYKNVTSDIITLNMSAIEELRDPDYMKTVIAYGFIHEILHMFQEIKSRYFKDSHYYTEIEDSTDYTTIYLVRNNLDLINKRLKFEFSEVFLKGIERQLVYPNLNDNTFNNKLYTCNTISGALCTKLNLNYEYIRSILLENDILRVIFPDKREFNLDLEYDTSDSLNLLINLIYLEDFKIVYIKNGTYKRSSIIFELY